MASGRPMPAGVPPVWEVVTMTRRSPRPHETAPLARCARWLGFDRNPLRRPTDRAEASVRLALLLLFLAAIPLAVVAGRLTDHVALRDVRVAAATDHRVPAVLLGTAVANVESGAYGVPATVWTPARWRAPDGPARSGYVLAPTGARRGSTVPVWTDASGAVTTKPGNHGTVVDDVAAATVGTIVGSGFLLTGGGFVAHLALNRRRFAAWDAQWGTAGPLWTGRQR
jgi:hypothetical protein